MAVRLVEQPVREYILGCAQAFLDGEESFQWITGTLMDSNLPRRSLLRILAPLRHYGDPFRAEVLFDWLDEVEW